MTRADRDPYRHWLYSALLAAGAIVRRRGRFEFLHLSDPASHLSTALQHAIRAAFSRETDALYRADTSRYWAHRTGYFSELSDLYTVHLEGALVGWAGLSLLDTDDEQILYIDTLNIRPRALRYSFDGYTLAAVFIHEIFIHHYLKARAPLPFAFRTQNPHVYRLARAIVPRGVYPPLAGHPARQAERGRALASAVASYLSYGKQFDTEHSVIRGAYGACLYGDNNPSVRTNEAELAEFWHRHVSLPAGDAVVIVVMPTTEEAALLALAYGAAVLRDQARRAAAPLNRWAQSLRVPNLATGALASFRRQLRGTP